jgi:hypothetical protein
MADGKTFVRIEWFDGSEYGDAFGAELTHAAGDGESLGRLFARPLPIRTKFCRRRLPSWTTTAINVNGPKKTIPRSSRRCTPCERRRSSSGRR